LNPFKEYFARAKSKEHYGSEFSSADLAPKFRKFFRTDTLVKIEVDGQVVSGKIDVSTGWKPSFVLVKSKPIRNTSRIVWLNNKHKIIAVKSPGQSRYKKV
jgi:hypothetical protein